VKIICPTIVNPALIQVYKNDKPNLEFSQQHRFEQDLDSMGPKTQYENIGVRIRAGNCVMVLNVPMNPIDAHIEIKANIRLGSKDKATQ